MLKSVFNVISQSKFEKEQDKLHRSSKGRRSSFARWNTLVSSLFQVNRLLKVREKNNLEWYSFYYIERRAARNVTAKTAISTTHTDIYVFFLLIPPCYNRYGCQRVFFKSRRKDKLSVIVESCLNAAGLF